MKPTWRAAAEFDKLEDEARAVADEFASHACRTHGEQIAEWQLRWLRRRLTGVAAAERWLDHHSQPGSTVGLALLDPMAYGDSFGDPSLVVSAEAIGPVRELAGLVASLTSDYPWSVGDATLFVLCGHTPSVTLIRFAARHGATHPRARRVTVTVDPAVVGARLLAEAYRQRTVARATPRQLRLARFIATRPVTETWEQSRAAWNLANPDDQARHPKTFIRDVRAAYGRVNRAELPRRGRSSHKTM